MLNMLWRTFYRNVKLYNRLSLHSFRLSHPSYLMLCFSFHVKIIHVGHSISSFPIIR